jgi:dolichol-phosphate mannosyltransferase
MKILVAIPVYNEESTVRAVVNRVRAHADHVLLIDDGSTDGTAEAIEEVRKPLGIDLIRHEGNVGYGRSLRSAFRRADEQGFDWIVTMDCDEQHEPDELPAFFDEIERTNADIISGSRYLDPTLDPVGEPPSSRRAINRTVTAEINDRLGLSLTDAFCGFKAHRVSALRALSLTEDGYAFPMQLWVQLVATGATITERAIRRIYNDPNRSFGGGLDDPEHRLLHYRGVMHREICAHASRLPASAAEALLSPCCGDA